MNSSRNPDMNNEGAAMKSNNTFRRRTGFWLGAAGVCISIGAVLPTSGVSHAASVTATNEEGMLCTTDGTVDPDTNLPTPTFELTATDGYTSEPDGNAIYDWGYSATGAFQLPGPILCVNEGDVVTVKLTNNLPVATSIQFPGQDNVTADGAPVGPVSASQADPSKGIKVGDLASLVPEVAGHTIPADPLSAITYKFTASQAGTYLYESGSDPQLQVQMGLFGAIVVRPNVTITADDILKIPADGGAAGVSTNGTFKRLGRDGTTIDDHMTVDEANSFKGEAACAYAIKPGSATCDPLAIYDGSRENILMLSEVDPGLHTYMEQNKSTPDNLTWNKYPGAYEAHYFMINGRSMPDTLAPNKAAWMPGQPYGAMAHVQPWDVHANPLDVLLRYVGVGVTGYDFHPHSNHEHVIAEDGALMKGAATGNDNTEEKFNIMVAPGSTVDATFRWTNEEGYSSTDDNRLPVAWPQGLNMTEGDFWSGSPYLGESGQLNAGILGKTQCGEYYHVAHSHDLTQATNYGITFGGMLTLIKVEPSDQAQKDLKLDCGTD